MTIDNLRNLPGVDERDWSQRETRTEPDERIDLVEFLQAVDHEPHGKHDLYQGIVLPYFEQGRESPGTIGRVIVGTPGSDQVHVYAINHLGIDDYDAVRATFSRKLRDRPVEPLEGSRRIEFTSGEMLVEDPTIEQQMALAAIHAYKRDRRLGRSMLRSVKQAFRR